MNSWNLNAKKSFCTILATATGALSVLGLTAGMSTPALAKTSLFNCSAEGVFIEVSRLNNGKLRYEAYNIPTNLQRPDLRIDGGSVSRDRNGDTVYRFRNRNYLYAAVQDQGYGKVLVYKNNRLIATKYCGDV